MLPFRTSVVCNFQGEKRTKATKFLHRNPWVSVFFSATKIPVRLRQAGLFCFCTWNFQPLLFVHFHQTSKTHPTVTLTKMVGIRMFPAHLDLSDGSMEYLEDGLPGLCFSD